MAHVPYEQIHDGEWIEPVRKGFVHQCCGCKLTHITDYVVVDKDKNPVPHVTIQFKVRVDKRKTAASRRKR